MPFLKPHVYPPPSPQVCTWGMSTAGSWDTWLTLPVPHQHKVLCPEGTSHNDQSHGKNRQIIAGFRGPGQASHAPLRLGATPLARQRPPNLLLKMRLPSSVAVAPLVISMPAAWPSKMRLRRSTGCDCVLTRTPACAFRKMSFSSRIPARAIQHRLLIPHCFLYRPPIDFAVSGK